MFGVAGSRLRFSYLTIVANSRGDRMQISIRSYLIAGISIVGAGVIAAAPTPPPPAQPTLTAATGGSSPTIPPGPGGAPTITAFVPSVPEVWAAAAEQGQTAAVSATPPAALLAAPTTGVQLSLLTGTPNLGFDNVGSFNTGIANNGVANTGVANIGNFNIGGSNTGDFDIGVNNQGSFNIGGGNTGDFNVGISNTGVRNFGAGNSGTLNFGFVNNGTANVGIGNTGVGNIGFFNTANYFVGVANIGFRYAAPPPAPASPAANPSLTNARVAEPQTVAAGRDSGGISVSKATVAPRAGTAAPAQSDSGTGTHKRGDRDRTDTSKATSATSAAGDVTKNEPPKAGEPSAKPGGAVTPKTRHDNESGDSSKGDGGSHK